MSYVIKKKVSVEEEYTTVDADTTTDDIEARLNISNTINEVNDATTTIENLSELENETIERLEEAEEKIQNGEIDSVDVVDMECFKSKMELIMGVKLGGPTIALEDARKDPKEQFVLCTEGIKDALKSIWEFIKKIFKWIGDKIKAFIKWIKGLFSQTEKKSKEIKTIISASEILKSCDKMNAFDFLKNYKNEANSVFTPLALIYSFDGVVRLLKHGIQNIKILNTEITNSLFPETISKSIVLLKDLKAALAGNDDNKLNTISKLIHAHTSELEDIQFNVRRNLKKKITQFMYNDNGFSGVNSDYTISIPLFVTPIINAFDGHPYTNLPVNITRIVSDSKDYEVKTIIKDDTIEVETKPLGSFDKNVSELEKALTENANDKNITINQHYIVKLRADTSVKELKTEECIININNIVDFTDEVPGLLKTLAGYVEQLQTLTTKYNDMFVTPFEFLINKNPEIFGAAEIKDDFNNVIKLVKSFSYNLHAFTNIDFVLTSKINQLIDALHKDVTKIKDLYNEKKNN